MVNTIEITLQPNNDLNSKYITNKFFEYLTKYKYIPVIYNYEKDLYRNSILESNIQTSKFLWYSIEIEQNIETTQIILKIFYKNIENFLIVDVTKDLNLKVCFNGTFIGFIKNIKETPMNTYYNLPLTDFTMNLVLADYYSLHNNLNKNGILQIIDIDYEVVCNLYCYLKTAMFSEDDYDCILTIIPILNTSIYEAIIKNICLNYIVN